MKQRYSQQLRQWRGARYFGLLLLTLLVLIADSFAAPQAASKRSESARNPEFVVPEGLRPRVQFWVDIFSRYGRFQSVLHHRDYPQIVFDVVDFSAAGETMTALEFERHKKAVLAAETARLTEAFRALASGAAPANELQQVVADVMATLPGGVAKYREVLKEDLLRSQTGIREKWYDAISRSGRYMYIIEQIFVRDNGLPIELTRLPFVESSFDYRAYSSVGAAGIWQFMPRTARLYMTVNNLVDERRDPISATEAATKYLRAAYNRLGTWPLAVTSYNHGVGGVAKAVKKMGSMNITALIEAPGSERPFGFASSNFFPSLLAALEVYEHYPHYFPDLAPEEPLRMAWMPLPNAASVRHVARQLEVSIDELRPLNYAIGEPVWQGRYPLPRGYPLKVPLAVKGRLVNLRVPEARVPVAVAAVSAVHGGVEYRVRKGDTLLSIARKFGVTPGEIRELNALPTTTVRVGQKLVVKHRTKPGVSPAPKRDRVAAPRPSQGQEHSQPGRYYTVKPGDTLWSIARTSNTTVATIQRLNGISKRGIKPGQRLKLP